MDKALNAKIISASMQCLIRVLMLHLPGAYAKLLSMAEMMPKSCSSKLTEVSSKPLILPGSTCSTYRLKKAGCLIAELAGYMLLFFRFLDGFFWASYCRFSFSFGGRCQFKGIQCIDNSSCYGKLIQTCFFIFCSRFCEAGFRRFHSRLLNNMLYL